MDEPTRRAWSKPELIVIVRGGPEEAVLNLCKVQGAEYGPTVTDGACLGVPDDGRDCGYCIELTVS